MKLVSTTPDTKTTYKIDTVTNTTGKEKEIDLKKVKLV